MPFPQNDIPGEETLRLRAVFVPRGAAVPSEMLEGMTDTIRIPAQFVPDEDAGQPEDDADQREGSATAADNEDNAVAS